MIANLVSDDGPSDNMDKMERDWRNHRGGHLFVDFKIVAIMDGENLEKKEKICPQEKKRERM